MRVKEAMTAGARMISPEDTIQEAAQKMRDFDIGLLPVCEGERLVGMITDRDIAVRSSATGDDPWTGHVRDVMTPRVYYCFEDQDVAEAARVMREKRVRRLVVLDHDRHMSGMVSLGDLATRADKQTAGATLDATARHNGARR
jgi:CBS domain-containing protein